MANVYGESAQCAGRRKVDRHRKPTRSVKDEAQSARDRSKERAASFGPRAGAKAAETVQTAEGSVRNARFLHRGLRAAKVVARGYRSKADPSAIKVRPRLTFETFTLNIKQVSCEQRKILVVFW